MSAFPRPLRPVCHVTHHALDRAVERLGWSRIRARSRLTSSYAHGVDVPPRIVRRLLGQSKRRRPKGAARYRVCGRAVLVCKSTTVVTVLRLEDDAYWDLFVWVLMGVLP